MIFEVITINGGNESRKIPIKNDKSHTWNRQVTLVLPNSLIDESISWSSFISPGLSTENNKRPKSSSRLTSSTVVCVYFSASSMNGCNMMLRNDSPVL
jgi:hypothetical protein